MSIFWFERAKLWWPNDDSDPEKNFDWVSKYIVDVDETTKRCREKRTVVQAGGYVGLWPIRLAQSFKRVITFEVQPSLQEALHKNCAKYPNIEVYDLGLGSINCEAHLMKSGTAGSWKIDNDGTEITNLITIDSLVIKDCDAIVLDIEGYEVEALKGAKKTIERCRPIIHVEELPRSQADIKAYLKSIKYVEVKKLHRDTIYISL